MNKLWGDLRLFSGPPTVCSYVATAWSTADSAVQGIKDLQMIEPAVWFKKRKDFSKSAGCSPYCKLCCSFCC